MPPETRTVTLTYLVYCDASREKSKNGITAGGKANVIENLKNNWEVPFVSKYTTNLINNAKMTYFCK